MNCFSAPERIAFKGSIRLKTAVLFLVAIFFSNSYAGAGKVEVSIHFHDSITVNDTIITVGQLGQISSSDEQLAHKIARFSAAQSAPPGYSRFLNTDELILFRLQPHFGNVAFSAAGQKRVKVHSDYVEKSVEAFKEQIIQFFSQNTDWKDDEWDLTINNMQRSWKMFRGETEVSFSELPSPYPRGSFNLSMIVKQGSGKFTVPVSCFVKVSSAVLVAKEDIRRGSPISAQSCTLVTMDITRLANTPYRTVSELEGKLAVRTIQRGAVLNDRMLRVAPVIDRGDQIMIGFENSGIRVSVMGVAREPGVVGDRIWVENMQTKRVLRAEITGRGRVTVFRGEENI